MARALGPTLELAASAATLARFERALARAPVKAKKGALRALNRTLRSGKAAASTEIRQVLNLKKAVVDQRIRTRVISTRALVGKVAVIDRRVELVEFMSKAQIASAYRRGQATRRGSRARRIAGVAVKPYKNRARTVYPGTFLNIGLRDRRWHVLKRTTAQRYPVYIQYGPNMIEDFLKTLPAFAARANAVLDKNLNQQFDYLLGDL